MTKNHYVYYSYEEGGILAVGSVIVPLKKNKK